MPMTSGLAEQTAAGTGLDDSRRMRPFDFRNPSKLAREQVRRLELTHETFQRSLGAQLSSALRTMVRLELLAIDQLTYDEYVRAMPNPTVIISVAMDPLPGTALIEMSTATSLTLVDRLLGGLGTPGLTRRPTELEASLVADLLKEAQGPLAETFEPLMPVRPEVMGVEFNPNFVHGANPSEMVVVMSYSLGILQGMRSEGLLTVCYPFSLLDPLWDADEEEADSPHALGMGSVISPEIERSLPDVPVPMVVRLRESEIDAEELATLQVGDVLRLDHKVNEPVVGSVAGQDLLEGRVGRKGKNIAIEISNWRNP